MDLAKSYQGLFHAYRKLEKRMSESPEDGLARELQSAARRIITFEHDNDLPELKRLVLAHGAATAKIEAAQAKLDKLERAIRNQELYLTAEFPTSDLVDETLNLLSWRELAAWGIRSVDNLTEEAAKVEKELKKFIKSHPGAADCLEVERSVGFDAKEREEWSWMTREFGKVEIQLEPQAA